MLVPRVPAWPVEQAAMAARVGLGPLAVPVPAPLHARAQALVLAWVSVWRQALAWARVLVPAWAEVVQAWVAVVQALVQAPPIHPPRWVA